MRQNVLEKEGRQAILLGNEAIVRGALEAGVQFVSTYPGTPASEIGDTFYKISTLNPPPLTINFYFEYSTNEKVALEAGVGASFSGLKTLVAMKDFGLNVCLDALLPFCYTGTKGPTVIVVADDPSCHSSAQSEQGTRGFAHLAHIPILEPSDPQECKDFTKLGLELSERFKMPFLLHTTTRVSHQAGLVKLERILKTKAGGRFIKDVKRFNTLPPRVLEMHKELLEKIEKIREYAEKSGLNSVYRSRASVKKLGVVTSGVSFLYVMEALKKLNLDIPVLKLGFFYPLPERKIKNFIKGLKRVLVVEELEPFLENEVQRLAKEANCNLRISGKELLPEVGELRPEIVTQALAKFTGKKYKIGPPAGGWKLGISNRRPQLCPGCPYWFVFGGVKKAVEEIGLKKNDIIFGGDIGCYMLAGVPPHNIQDYLSCMGSSIGIAHGIKKAIGSAFAKASASAPRASADRSSGKQKLITFIGDSTFFHAGIPALINVVYNQSNPLIIIMDNQTTAMTGHQPHPGIKTDDAPVVKIEDIVSACGVKNLKIIDPVEQKEFIKIIKEFLEKDDVSVIIARRPCKFVKK